MLLPRAPYETSPPELRTRMQDHPTLLFTWWCTGFSFTIIILRLAGRYIRTERFFTEDKIMAASLIPLLVRMAFIHIVLLYGTNNVDISHISESEALLRATGSRLVLGARIFYTMFIWTAKFTVSEFLKRLTERFWKRSYELVLRGIRIFLVVTFIVVVIATLSECHPFSHFWQVTPDPGHQCRQGYAHLFSMGVADIITDILLVVFPIPIILRSAMSWKRKFDLVALFSMSLILIGITAARVPSVIERRGRQQYRTVFASCEILAATAVSNAVILGSFLRDRGLKKNKKYKYGSTTDSMDRPSTRRPTVATQQWGSDEDLIRDVGIRLAPELHESPVVPRPAPIALPASPTSDRMIDPNWQFPSSKMSALSRDSESDLKVPLADPYPSPRDRRMSSSRRNVSFFDVGGLLETGSEVSISQSPSTIQTQDFASTRRGSRALLSDLGGLLSQSRGHGSYSSSRRPSRNPQIDEGIELHTRNSPSTVVVPPTGVLGPMLTRQETLQSLQDVGGLLDGNSSSTNINNGLSTHQPQPIPRVSISSTIPRPHTYDPSHPSSSSANRQGDSSPLLDVKDSRR